MGSQIAMVVQQYLLGVIDGYERCIKLVEYYEVDEDKANEIFK